jgi:hypothetical protein
MATIKTKAATLLITLLTIGVVFYGFIFLGNEGEYTKNDKLKYYLTTPSIITNVPKVTNDYHFSYTPDDNYGFEINSIEFNNIENIEQAEKILSQYIDKQNLQLNVNEQRLVINAYHGEKQSLIVTLITYTRQ